MPLLTSAVRDSIPKVCFGMKKLLRKGTHVGLMLESSSLTHLVGNYRIMGQSYVQPELCYTVADVFVALSGKSLNINKNRCSW